MGLSALMFLQWLLNLFQLPHISPSFVFISPHLPFIYHAPTFQLLSPFIPCGLPHIHRGIHTFLSRRALPLRKHPFCHCVFPDYKQRGCRGTQLCCYATSEWRRCECVSANEKVYGSHFSSFQWYCHYTVGNRISCCMMMSWKVGVGWGSVILQQTLSKLKNVAYENYRFFIGEQLVTFSKSLLRVLMVLQKTRYKQFLSPFIYSYHTS